MGLFRRKSREVADKAREVTPGAEPRRDEGVGSAGYDSIRYDKKVKQPRGFNMRRPDGQPPQDKKAGRRGRGFFS